MPWIWKIARSNCGPIPQAAWSRSEIQQSLWRSLKWKGKFGIFWRFWLSHHGLTVWPISILRFLGQILSFVAKTCWTQYFIPWFPWLCHYDPCQATTASTAQPEASCFRTAWTLAPWKLWFRTCIWRHRNGHRWLVSKSSWWKNHVSEYHIISFHYSWFVNVCYIPKRHVQKHALPPLSIISASFDFVTSPKWSSYGHFVVSYGSSNHRSGRPFNCVALPKRRLWGYSSPWPPNIKAQTSVTGVSGADVVLRCIGLIGWKTWKHMGKYWKNMGKYGKLEDVEDWIGWTNMENLKTRKLDWIYWTKWMENMDWTWLKQYWKKGWWSMIMVYPSPELKDVSLWCDLFFSRRAIIFGSYFEIKGIYMNLLSISISISTSISISISISIYMPQDIYI